MQALVGIAIRPPDRLLELRPDGIAGPVAAGRLADAGGVLVETDVILRRILDVLVGGLVADFNRNERAGRVHAPVEADVLELALLGAVLVDTGPDIDLG